MNLLPKSMCDLSDTFCGCGDPELAYQWISDYLTRISNQNTSYKVPTTGPEYIAIYLMDHLGFTEHGSTIHGSWLTDRGKEVLEFISNNGTDWQEKEWIGVDGVYRGTIE